MSVYKVRSLKDNVPQVNETIQGFGGGHTQKRIP